MGKRKTTEQFKQEVFDLVGDDFVFEGKYEGAKSKLIFTHNIENCGHKFPMDPTHFLRGQRCPECKKKTLSVKMSKNTETFRQEVFDLVGDEYSVAGEYISAKDKILIKHNLCGSTFQMTPSHFLGGERCTNEKCLRKRQSDGVFVLGNGFTERFEEYVDEYELLSQYTGWHKGIVFKHKSCGCIFERSPAVFFRGKLDIKCPDCILEYVKQVNSKTPEQFKEELFEMYQGEYAVLGQYVDSVTKVEIQHNVCGNSWEVRPYNILSGKGCPVCNESKGERAIRYFLNNNGVHFDPQKTFDGLLGLGGRNLSYDFYLPEYNLLVEFHGEQHKSPVDFWGGEEAFTIQQEHDRRKKEYAKTHGVDLLEIWYWDFDNIEEILAEYLNLYDEKAC